MPLTLLIPELVWSNPDEPGAFSPLAPSRTARLLARIAPARLPRGSTETLLVTEAGWPVDLPAPLAALRLAGEADQGGSGDALAAAHTGFWLCADPVHLRFHQDRLILGDASRLDLSPDEAATLVADLNRALAPASVHAPHPGRWYLCLPEGGSDDTGSPPPSEVTGRALHPGQLGDSRLCRRLANEIQILLHDHPVNAARAARGAAPVNAVWLWGGGRLPDACPLIHPVSGENILARGLARIASRGAAPLNAPSDFRAITATPDAPALVLVDDLLAPSHYQEADAFCTAWQLIDQRWLSPALGALRRGQVDVLRIIAPTAYGTLRWQLRPSDLWRAALTPRWLHPRAAQDFAALAQQLVQTQTR